MKSSDIEERIIGCIKEHGLHGASSTEISKALGINRHTLAKYLNILNAEGKIGFKRAGMGKIWFIEKSPLHGVSNGSKDIVDTGLKTTLGHILSTMPDGIVVENENYEIEFMNESLIKKFGNRVGEKCYKAFIGRDEPCVKCPVTEILHKGNLAPMRYQATDKDDKSYDLIASPMKNPDGSVSVIEMVRDITEMKRAEEAMRGSEEMYKTLVKTSPEAVTVTDLEGNITYVSQRTLEIHGFKKTKELIGKNAFEFISPEDHENAAANLQKTLTEGVSRGLEYTLLRKDGTTFTGELNAALIKDANGKPNAFIATTRDITERKEAREAVRESEEEFRLTFENAKDAIFWADPKTGLITNCNRAAETLLERERHEIIGLHQTKLHSPEKSEYYSNQFKEHIERKGAVDDEAEIITKSGKIKPVHISASVTLIRGKPVIQGIFRDITERKKAEDALKNSEDRFRILTENAPIGIYYNDMNGAFLYGNKKAEEIVGYESNELVGKNFLELKLLSSKDVLKATKLLTLNRMGKPTGPDEFEISRKDGTTKSIEVRTKVVTINGEKTVLGMVEDITERKGAENRIKYLNELKRSVIDNAPFGILTGDKEGNIIHTNPAIIQILGSPSEEKTKSLNLFKLAAIKKAGLDKVFKKVLMEGKEFDLEKEYVSHWGKRIFARLKVFPLMDMKGKVTGLVAIVEDITEKKNLEAEIIPVPEPLTIPEAQSISP